MCFRSCRSAPPITRRSRPSGHLLLFAPADLFGFGGGDALHAFHGLVGHQLDAGVVEVQPGRDLRIHVVTDLLGDGLDAELGHLQRVLLRRRPDDPALDRRDSGLAATIDGDDSRLHACCLQSLGGADSGRLVDGVDQVYVLGLGQAGLHRGLALVRGPVGGLVADDLVISALATGVLAGLVLIAVLLLVLDVDAHAGQEALVTVVVHGGDLVVEQLEHGYGGLLPVQRPGGPLADQFAGREVVGGEGDVHDIRRVGRGVQRDHVETGIAGRLDRRVDPVGGRRDQNALVTAGDGRLDGRDLGRLVAVFLTRRRGDRDVVGLAGLFGALLHSDEERVGAGFGDQRDRDLLAAAAITTGALATRSSRVTAATRSEGQGRSGREGQDGQEAPASTVRRYVLHSMILSIGTHRQQTDNGVRTLSKPFLGFLSTSLSHG